MFGNLSDKLARLVGKLGIQAKISEDSIQDIVREIRMTLLEADVALPVVKELTNRVREQAIGQVVADRLNPGQTFVKILLDELTRVLGGEAAPLSFARTRPIVMLLAGLQGAGKTTTAAKLGLWLKSQKHSALLCSVDIYRPAAREQLAQLCEQSGLICFAPEGVDTPVDIATAAVQQARLSQLDVCLVDTAGRTSLDEAMMDEIAAISQAISPSETLLVVDAMTGQDAANTASAFHQRLGLTGVVLAKADSDARGGSALSIATLANCPIRFAGVGEKTTALEAFDPQRMARRILGMGDVLGMIEQAEAATDRAAMTRLEKKIRTSKGRGFDMLDYRAQLEQIQKMGGMGGVLATIPGMSSKLDSESLNRFASNQARWQLALIDSMTVGERSRPDIINPSRKRRITRGAGAEPVELNRLIKQFKQMSKMMGKLGNKGGMRRMLNQLQSMGTQGR